MATQTKADQERGHTTEKNKIVLKTNSLPETEKKTKTIMMQQNIVKVYFMGQKHKLTAFIQVRNIKYD